MSDREKYPPPPPPPPPAPPSRVEDGDFDLGLDFPSAPTRGSSQPSASVSVAAQNPMALPRDRIVILGRRRAGKTIFLARLYEALWQGCKLVDGKMVNGEANTAAPVATRISCRATTGVAHSQLMRIAEELRKGRWPAATAGNTYSEIEVDHSGRKHLITVLDYPGEVFRKAFMSDSEDPDALELRMAVDRAAAAILLIDPSVVAAGGEESHEDVFGLTQATLRIRQTAGGTIVPVAIVFTKCDLNAALLREAGGTRAFARKHFAQLFRELDRTSVFSCAAVRVVQGALGKPVPTSDRSPENVVEPLRYCIESLERGIDITRAETARTDRAQAMRAAEDADTKERKKSAMAWIVFAVAVGMLFVAVGIGAAWWAMKK